MTVIFIGSRSPLLIALDESQATIIHGFPKIFTLPYNHFKDR